MPVVLCPRPACGRKLDVAAAALGNAVRCPHCGQVFRLSQPTAPPLAAPLTSPAATLSKLPETASASPAPTLSAPPLATPVKPQGVISACPAATMTDQALVPTTALSAPWDAEILLAQESGSLSGTRLQNVIVPAQQMQHVTRGKHRRIPAV
jgi:hypothetical protein